MNILNYLGFEKNIIWSGNILLPRYKRKPNRYKNYTYRVSLKYVSKEDRWIRDNFKGDFGYSNYLYNLFRNKNLHEYGRHRIRRGEVYIKKGILWKKI